MFDRNTGIGASECAAALGMSAWRTPYVVWARKTGRVGEQAESEAMLWGKLHEPAIEKEFIARQNIFAGDCEECAGPILHKDPDKQYLYATPDRLLPWAEELAEFKCTSTVSDHFQKSGDDEDCSGLSYQKDWGEENSSNVPVDYYFQAQHQMMCTGTSGVHFAVLFNGNKLKFYYVPRHDDMIASIEDGLAKFWESVKADRPPEADFAAESVRKTLRSVRMMDGEMDATTELQNLAYAWDEAKSNESKAKKVKERLRAQIEYATDGIGKVCLMGGDELIRKRVAYTRPPQEAKPVEYYTLTLKKVK